MMRINLHHFRAALAAFLLLLTEGSAGIVFVKKPWVKGCQVCGLKTPGFKIIVSKVHINAS